MYAGVMEEYKEVSRHFVRTKNNNNIIIRFRFHLSYLFCLVIITEVFWPPHIISQCVMLYYWWSVTLPLSSSVTLSLCHSLPLSLCHSVTLSLCHSATIFLCHSATLSLQLEVLNFLFSEQKSKLIKIYEWQMLRGSNKKYLLFSSAWINESSLKILEL